MLTSEEDIIVFESDNAPASDLGDDEENVNVTNSLIKLAVIIVHFTLINLTTVNDTPSLPKAQIEKKNKHKTSLEIVDYPHCNLTFNKDY